ncbi:MAG TPA: N-acetylglucosamine-6-phosphate deacetylase [Acidimicrobiia bacterium]|nr:N-acetylglucosamine-6-phosphate deacetylase [Acidimicrobiia bacterium]
MSKSVGDSETTVRLGVGAAVVGSDLVTGDVEVSGGMVEAVGLAPAGTGLAIPGFVDLQVNGFAGVDFLSGEPDDIIGIGPALAATGVVAYQPTLISSPIDISVRAANVISQAMGALGPRIIGLHLEGPFLSPKRAGAHPLTHLREPEWDLVAPILEAGPVTMMTLAPELAGAVELITRLAGARIVVSLGHSDATANEAGRGFDAGARAVTHLFNAMRPFSHRDPGIAGCAMARSDVYLGVIADAVHLSDEAILTVWRAAAGRMVVVTDAIAAAGMPPGHWTLGDVGVDVSDGQARRQDGTLAGSVGTMDESFRYLVSLGLPLGDAVAATSSSARQLMGLPGGTLRPGEPADVVVLDDSYTVRRTIIGGVEA